MKKRTYLLFLAVCFLTALNAAEYFISVKGSDKNPGTSEKAPFRTIKRAISKLAPGDTVTILPGEYHEQNIFRFSGDPKRPTRIRAKIPGTVHLRGDVPAPRFTAVPGRKSVYVCKVDRIPEYVLERDTVQKYKKTPSIAETEVTPGSSFFDLKNKRVYIHTSDGRAPEYHCITFSVLRGDAFRILAGKLYNFHVEGIMFSGYNSATPNGTSLSTFGGVTMRNPVNCSVRNCIVYLSGSGVVMTRFADSVVEDCVFFANSNDFNGSGGNLVLYGPGKTSVQRNIITFASGMAGQRFYGSPFDRCLIDSCYSFDNKYGDIWIKYASDTAWVKNSYASSLIRSRHIENSIFTTGDIYYHGRAKKSICRSREPKFDPAKEFADPAHLDFRLRKNSIFRKGEERGIKGYDPKVIFDDDSKLLSGGTLYLTKKRSAPLRLRNLQNIIIRGRGVMPVVLQNDLRLENCRNVRLENVNIMGNAAFPGTTGLTVRRSAFVRDVTFPAGSQVRHNLFMGKVKGADRGFLRGNIFCTSYTGKPLFSGWNAYVKGNIPAFEVASWKAPKPLFNDPSKGDFTLKNHYLFAGKSADGFPTGQYRYDRVFVTDGMGLRTGALSSRSAVLLIDSSVNSTARVVLTAPDGRKISKSESGFGEYAVSFTGLQPGKTYKVQCVLAPQAEKRLTNAPKSSSRPRRFACTFKTPANETPRIWHVSPRGNNANDGSTPAKALAEINAAVKRARPGDTVLIAGGTYKELVRVLSTGAKGKYLTIAGAPGAEVVIDGAKILRQGILIRGQEYVIVDNLTLKNHMGSGAAPDSAGVVVRNSSEIQVKRIFYDNRHGSNQRSFIGQNVKNMLLENSVAIKPFGGYEFWKCPGLEIRHCVFFRGQTINGRIGTSVTAPASVHHCIFVGEEIQKVKNPVFGATEISTFTEYDNGFFTRLPRSEKPIIGFNTYKGKVLPKNDGGGILNREWKKQGRFYNQILKYDDFCKEQKRKPTALFGNPRMKALPFYMQFKSSEHWNKVFYHSPHLKKELREARRKELQEKRILKITDFIAANPEFLKRKIGLDPKAFGK